MNLLLCQPKFAAGFRCVALVEIEAEQAIYLIIETGISLTHQSFRIHRPRGQLLVR